MAKKDTAAAIKAANGSELNIGDYTQVELDTLLALAEKGEAGRADYDAQVVALKGKGQSQPAPAKEKLVTVRVADAIAAYGGEFTDPDTHAVIGKAAVAVPQSAFVREKLRSDELVEE